MLHSVRELASREARAAASCHVLTQLHIPVSILPQAGSERGKRGLCMPLTAVGSRVLALEAKEDKYSFFFFPEGLRIASSDVMSISQS